MEEIYCFAGNPLDRVSERRRDAEWIASLLDEPTSRLLPLRDLKPSVRNGGEVELEWQRFAPWRAQISLADASLTRRQRGTRGFSGPQAAATTAARHPL
jgi:hypothetical protein